VFDRVSSRVKTILPQVGLNLEREFDAVVARVGALV
jgi:hypothetical protein